MKRIGIFGSRARGEGKETSDVDVLVEFIAPSFDNFMDLAFFLEDLFERNVDLVTTGGLSPHIAPVVEREVVWAGEKRSWCRSPPAARGCGAAKTGVGG